MSWKPIESAPRDGTVLLLSCLESDNPKPWVTIGWFDHIHYWRGLDSMGKRFVDPTHWQPLPSPPCAHEYSTSVLYGVGMKPEGVLVVCNKCGEHSPEE